MKKLFLPLLFSAILCGCVTTSTTLKTEGITVTTVDTGMKTWALYVEAHLKDGKVNQNEINNVQTAYTAYYNAQLVTEAYLESSVSTGSTNDIASVEASVTTAETSLLALINQYLNQ
jgi:hypothetical protein